MTQSRNQEPLTSNTLSVRLVNKPVNDPFEYIFELYRMEHPHVSDYDIVQNPGHTLRHLHYGFEITPLSNEFIRTTSIACVCSKNIMIASGNLEQWRTVVLNDTPALRPIVNRVMLLLEAEGLSRLWLGYQKVKVDNVFKLERRRS